MTYAHARPRSIRPTNPDVFAIGDLVAWWDAERGTGEIGVVTEMGAEWVHTDEWARDKRPMFNTRSWFLLAPNGVPWSRTQASVNDLLYDLARLNLPYPAAAAQIRADEAWVRLRGVTGNDTDLLSALTGLVAAGWTPEALRRLVSPVHGGPALNYKDLEALAVNGHQKSQGPVSRALVRLMQRITAAADRKTLQMRAKQREREWGEDQ